MIAGFNVVSGTRGITDHGCGSSVKVAVLLQPAGELGLYQADFQIYPGDGGVTISAFLTQQFPRATQEQLQARGYAGHIVQNGVKCHIGELLTGSGTLSVILPEHEEDPYQDDWQLIWESPQFMVVYKPPMLPVSRTTRNLYGTLISEIRRKTPWRDARLMHRLDAETSGLILLAKYEAADRRWKKKIDRLLVRKIYQALVAGEPAWDEVDITLALSERRDSAIRTRMYAVAADAVTGADSAYTSVKACHTRVRCLQRRGAQSLVECELFTGRKHQIRAHLAAVGHPVMGDKIYSYDGRFYLQRLQQPLSEDDFRLLGARHQQLQAVSLTLALPEGEVTVDLPEALRLSTQI